VNIVILGYNDAEKARIIDQLEEYFEYTQQDVLIDIYNEIDKLALLHKSMDNQDFPEDDRIAFAHLYLATVRFFVLPQWDKIFFKVTNIPVDRLYEHVFEELGLDDLWADVIGLPLGANEAADLVRQVVEGIENDSSDTPEDSDGAPVRGSASDGG
jgi:hypothetical protein